ncbi:hypothetical protein KY327_03195 [Candidatus Woesearchaeota archaeon]|nr:hypothetical protein [Candidatus Woesearchaeota archaeon]
MGSKKFLKIPAIFIVLGVLVVGGASAALVNYLSNTVGNDVTVESPIQYEISKGDGWQESIAMDAVGGDTVEYKIKATNQANNEIDGKQYITIRNTDGVTCDDFQELSVMTDDSGQWVDLLTVGNCQQVNDNNIEIMFDTNAMASGATETTDVKATFQPNALGTYESTTKMVIQSQTLS